MTEQSHSIAVTTKNLLDQIHSMNCAVELIYSLQEKFNICVPYIFKPNDMPHIEPNKLFRYGYIIQDGLQKGDFGEYVSTTMDRIAKIIEEYENDLINFQFSQFCFTVLKKR